MHHPVKTAPAVFEAIKNHVKNFDIRRKDNKIEVGDIMVYKEYGDSGYTGREYKAEVIYKQDNYYCRDGFVTIGLAVPMGQEVNIVQTANDIIQIENVKNLDMTII